MAGRQVANTNGDASWRKQAECRPGNGHDPETWFPTPPSPWSTRKEQRAARVRRLEQERRAKAVCLSCPVLDECRQFADDNDERTGIWGGLTETERGKTPIR
jgi:WhiB family redox-sensing transcriptional regulator